MADQRSAFFTKFAKATANATGKPITFAIAASVVLVWAITGPLFDFSDTWQLVINTGTTIVTFLMVFLIQNTQNRDSLAVQLKLDELICSIAEANNESLNLEDRDEKDLAEKQVEMMRLANEGNLKSQQNGNSTDQQQEEQEDRAVIDGPQ